MKKLIIIAISFFISCTDSPTETVRPNVLTAKINGVPYAFIVDLAVLQDDGSPAISGAYCVAGRIPRNLSISIGTPDLNPKTYIITTSLTVDNIYILVNDMDGDAGTGSYRPINAGKTQLTVEGYDRKTGRFFGKFEGIFEVDPSFNPDYRYFPDTLYVESGLFDLYLVFPNEFIPIWEYPCFPS